MVSPMSSRAGSMKTVASVSVVDDFFSVFDRESREGSKPQQPAHKKSVSTENLLRKSPVVEKTALGRGGDAWNSGFFRRVPYLGMLAILAVLLCAAGDGIVLWKSDGQEVSSVRMTIITRMYISANIY